MKKSKNKNKLKINKGLAYTLFTLILVMLGYTINQTLANEGVTSRESKLQNFYENKKSIELEKESEIKLDNVISRIEKILTAKNEYKTLFEDTVRNELKGLPEYKLRLALTRINSNINSTKYNQLLNENYKSNMIAQLLAIKDIIVEIQYNNNKIKDTMDLGEFIK